MQSKPKKVLIAAGGTGGHMFPAQALAAQLKEKNYPLLFAGGKLATNRYFRKDLFPFKQVASATFFRGKLTRYFFAFAHIVQGIFQSIKVLEEFQPDVVVGFGSFHSFPLLAAAIYKRIPLVLFESNAMPGRVNRLFSRYATVSAVQFSKAIEKLKGKSVEVGVPFWEREGCDTLSRAESRGYFSLDADKLTFLVFGGSQGSAAVNRAFIQALKNLGEMKDKIQVIHLTGSEAFTEEMKSFYQAEGIRACVKPFEEKMHHAWTSADLVVCRSGAATLSELLTFEVPGILIPFPTASEDHQRINAAFMEEVGGALHFTENQLQSPNILSDAILGLLDPKEQKLQIMKQALKDFKKANQKKSLCSVICELA